MRRNGRRYLRPGYTMVELVIAILILAVMASIATTAISRVSARYSLESAADQLVADLQRARIEAIRRNTAVSVTFANAYEYDVEFIGVRPLPENVIFQSNPAEVRFASFGPVQTGSATFVLERAGETRQVLVTTAGHSEVSP